MKFTQTITACILISLLAIGGCKKDKDNDDAVGGSGTVTVERLGIGSGTPGKFSSTAAGIIQVTAAGVTVFTVTAIKDGSKESITAIINHKITGSETIDLSYNNAEGSGIIYSKDYTKPADGTLNYKTTNFGAGYKGGGQLKITKLDGSKVEGEFYFSAYNTAGESAWAEQGTFSGTIK
ncbi:hypothetical protein FW774_04545 (plasmid) [Pedobacter sp. BS3]|uniref:hypothetical protein n=1 Tax=Pedobacter sp. BS3 TaxID=2567937 RepID=UPI0011EF9CCD|nr:hypothetical protein [Pedobacter sp. BS3]TZF86322.1 hypothetical protein FW774_04545 [Pedobacter sp. BS3]